MPLIDLQTDLKSLKFGTFAPYVVTDINNPPTANSFSLPVRRRIEDVIRLSKMFIDTPGITFAAKQAALSVISDHQGNLSSIEFGAALKDAGLDVANTITTILAQAGASGTGTHFELFNRDDVYTRVTPRQGNFINPNGLGTDIPNNYLNTPSVLADRGHEMYDFNKNEYEAVPHVPALSVEQSEIQRLEAGRVLRTAFQTGSNLDPYATKTSDNFSPILGFSPKEEYYGVERTEHILEYSNRYKKFEYDDVSINKETRVNLGNQAGRLDKDNVKNNRYWIATKDSSVIDKINAYDVGQGELPTGADEPTVAVDFKGRDLIKFRYYIDGVPLHFRAHLTNFNDENTASWNSSRYVGRADNFYTYNGYNRNITIGFTIAATTRNEMKPLWRKLNYLASATTAKYTDVFMQGVITRVTVGNYLYRVPCVLNNVSISVSNEYLWDIALREPEGSEEQEMLEMPMVCDVTTNLSVIHDFTPQVGSPLIAKKWANNLV